MTSTHDQLCALLLRELQHLTTGFTDIRTTVESLPQPADGSKTLSARDTLLGQTNKLLDSFSALQGRANANTVAVMVSGLLKTGKSSTVNALIGAMCCPVADNAGTSGVLTIDVVNDRKDYELSTNKNRDLLKRGTAFEVQEQLRAINARLRAADQADSEESDLLLRAPSRSDEGSALRVVDSPGANSDLSPNICARWKQSIYAVDVLIMVSDFSPFGSSDEGELWRQLADELANIGVENIVLLINKYDQATVDEGDEDGHRERTKLERIEYVQKATSGRIVLKPEQVFLGCARNAMIARTIQNLPSDAEQQGEQKELLGLVNRVFYPNDTREFSSAGELRSAEDWDEVYRASGFAELDQFLQTKAEVATLAHLHKLVTLARASANRISSTSTTSYRQLAESEASAQTVIQNIASSKTMAETYFNDEAREEDELYQKQLHSAISYLCEQLRVDLHDASFDQLMQTLPEETPLGGEDTDNTQLVDILRTLREQAQSRLATESASFRERLHTISQKRSELMQRFLADIKQIFDAHRVVIPNGILEPDTLQRNSTSDGEAVTAFIDQSFAWLEGFLSLDTTQLVNQAIRTLRLKYAPGSVLDVAVDFAQNPRGDGRVSGSWILEGQTCKLRHGSQLVVGFDVKTEFVGQPFVLEVQHLTSDAGEKSRSAVNVKVNDTTIRTAFDPRAAYEVNGNKIGLWYYVTDRWLVSPDLIKEGENTVTFEYADGTTLYWLKRLNMKATRPNVQTQVLRREDIVSTFIATALEQLDLKENQRASLNDKIATTAPLAVQRVAFNRCLDLLLGLTRAAEQGGDFVKETRATLAKVVGQCAGVLRVSTGVVNELAQIGAASSS